MDTENTPPARRRGRRGSGSQRQVRPGVWEVRVPPGNNTGAGPSRRRSVTVHGAEAQATRARTALVATLTDPTALPPGVVLTVGQLLAAWLVADHPWKPSTVLGYQSTVRALQRDPVAGMRVLGLSPRVVRDLVDGWRGAGVTAAVTAARIRIIRSAVGWAWDERLIEVHPVRFLRGPGRFPPRRPLTENDVRALLASAELRLLEAHANHSPDTGRGTARQHRAEQDLLLVRLAADTGARRGELAALQLADCTGRVLRIERAFSADVLTTPKSGHGRVLTVGASTAKLWHTLAGRWADRAAGRWGLGCSAPIRPTGNRSAPVPSGTGSTPSATPPASPGRPCTGYGTALPPSWSCAARSCRPRPALATPTPPPPCASTPTPCH